MKTIKEALLVTLWATIVCILSISAMAQSGVDVMNAELALDFSKVEGKLLSIDAGLVFIDDSNPRDSFLIDRSNFNDVSGEREILTVTTVSPVTFRTSRQSRFVFRLQDHQATEVAALLKAGQSPVRNISPTSNAANVNPVSTGIYEAKHNHRLYGSCTGRLVFSDDRISFESADDRDHSRQFLLTDIKKLSRNSPYDFGIKQFKGDGLTLEILGLGIDIVDFKKLEDRIAVTKSSR